MGTNIVRFGCFEVQPEARQLLVNGVPTKLGARAILGQIYLERRSFDLALRHTERGVEINPANQWNRADLGSLLSYIGRAEEGLEMLRDARRADPYFGPRWYWRGLGIAQFVLRRYADALPDFERVPLMAYRGFRQPRPE